MKHFRAIGGALALCVLLAACQQAVTTKEPDPEPDPQPTAPTLSFEGAWQTTTDWYDDDVMMGTYTDTLTFTESRYILNRLHYRTGSTSIDHDWTHSGDWEFTEDTITRIHLHDDDDDGETPEILNRVRKNYYWIEGRSSLCMQRWDDDSEMLDRRGCELYKRMMSPVPAETALSGVWEAMDEYEHHETGQTVYRKYTITIDSSNNAFAFEFEASGASEETVAYTGPFTHDAGKFMILVTVDSATNVEDGETIDASNWSGQVLRLGYAPTGKPNQVKLSLHWDEHGWDTDQTRHTDEANPYHPYGNYEITFTRMTN